MSKKITFGAKPSTPTPSADAWVTSRTAPGEPAASGAAPTPADEKSEIAPEPGEPMKRLTIDIPATLHTQIKSQCALRSTKMADEIRALLETHFTTK